MLIFTLGTRDLQIATGPLVDLTRSKSRSFWDITQDFAHYAEEVEIVYGIDDLAGRHEIIVDKKKREFPFGLKFPHPIPLDDVPPVRREQCLFLPQVALCLQHILQIRTDAADLKVILVATQQDPPDADDTLHAATIAKAFVEKVCPDWPVEIKIITQSPENHDAMVKWFEAEILSEVIRQKQCFLHISGGTPAMGYAAATTIGILDTVTTLYTTRPENPQEALLRKQVFVSTSKVEAGINLARKRTQEIARHALGAATLNPEDLRFFLENSLSTGVSQAEKEAVLPLLRAWEAWERFDPEASKQFLDMASIPGFEALRAHLDYLCADPDVAANNTADFWQARLWDNALRADLAARRRDTVSLLFAWANFREVSPLYRLSYLSSTAKMVYDDEASWQAWQKSFPTISIKPKKLAYNTISKEDLVSEIERQSGLNNAWRQFQLLMRNNGQLHKLWRIYNKQKHSTVRLPLYIFADPFSVGDDIGTFALAYLLIFMLEKATDMTLYCNPWLAVREKILAELGVQGNTLPSISGILTATKNLSGIENTIKGWLGIP